MVGYTSASKNRANGKVAALADGLRRRGVGDAEAGLAAEAGAAVYGVAFQRWVDAADDLDLRDALRQSFAQLRTLTASA